MSRQEINTLGFIPTQSEIGNLTAEDKRNDELQKRLNPAIIRSLREIIRKNPQDTLNKPAYLILFNDDTTHKDHYAAANYRTPYKAKRPFVEPGIIRDIPPNEDIIRFILKINNRFPKFLLITDNIIYEKIEDRSFVLDRKRRLHTYISDNRETFDFYVSQNFHRKAVQ